MKPAPQKCQNYRRKTSNEVFKHDLSQLIAVPFNEMSNRPQPAVIYKVSVPS